MLYEITKSQNYLKYKEEWKEAQLSGRLYCILNLL